MSRYVLRIVGDDDNSFQWVRESEEKPIPQAGYAVGVRVDMPGDKEVHFMTVTHMVDDPRYNYLIAECHVSDHKRDIIRRKLKLDIQDIIEDVEAAYVHD